MKFTVVTLFPQLIESFGAQGLIGQAAERGRVDIQTLNPRQFTEDAHHTVDDRAFGGSDGMVMKVEPLQKAISHLRSEGKCRVSVLTPQGRVWNQALAREFAADENVHHVLVCGRYAGIDQRFSVLCADDEISVGDYVLNGGEVAACAVIESVTRLLPQVLGNQQSAAKDSFSDDLLECPQFTRPREVDGLSVPAPLLSGNHENIRAFERAMALVRTALLRPERLRDRTALPAAVKLVSALSDGELRSAGLTRSQLERLWELR